VPSLEQILCRGRFRHPGSYRRIPSLSTVCTRTFLEVTDNGSGIADSQVASREGLGFSNMRARARKYRRTTKRSHCVGSRYYYCRSCTDGFLTVHARPLCWLLLSGFRTKGPWSVETPALGVICAWSNLCIPACIIVPDRSVSGRTTRKPQQRDGGDDQKQLTISISI
jgi:hypothetical protein